jgi:beta-glucosidase-like glycosyl hydrolase
MCANGFILNRVVRNTWGWKGFVVSDCDALNTMMVRGEPGGNSAFGHAYSLNGAMAGVSLCDSAFRRTVWRLYGDSKGLVM